MHAHTTNLPYDACKGYKITVTVTIYLKTYSEAEKYNVLYMMLCRCNEATTYYKAVVLIVGQRHSHFIAQGHSIDINDVHGYLC